MHVEFHIKRVGSCSEFSELLFFSSELNYILCCLRLRNSVEELVFGHRNYSISQEHVTLLASNQKDFSTDIKTIDGSR